MKTLHHDQNPDLNGPIGKPPKYFSPARRAIWRELLRLVKPGTLLRRDQFWLSTARMGLDDLRMRRRDSCSPLGYRFVSKMLAGLGLERTVRLKLMGPQPRNVKSAVSGARHARKIYGLKPRAISLPKKKKNNGN